MSKNTRWALALVGVVIIIVAAVVIGTGGDKSDATLSTDHAEHSQSENNNSDAGATGTTGSTGSSGSDQNSGSGNNSGGSGTSTDSDDNSGGAGPDTSGSGSGAASPSSVVVSPVLTASGSKTVKVDKGETVTIRARSGRASTLHIHGYNKMIELKPDKVGRVTFKASIDGEFEIELHNTDGEVQVGTLRVSP